MMQALTRAYLRFWRGRSSSQLYVTNSNRQADQKVANSWITAHPEGIRPIADHMSRRRVHPWRARYLPLPVVTVEGAPCRIV